MIIRVNINLSSSYNICKIMILVWVSLIWHCSSQHAFVYIIIQRERVSFNEWVSFDTAVHNMLLFISSFRERERISLTLQFTTCICLYHHSERESLIDTAVHNMLLFISSFRERVSFSEWVSIYTAHLSRSKFKKNKKSQAFCQCRGLSKTHTKILRCVTTFLDGRFRR